MLCILYVGTIPILCILNVGTVPMLCILNVGTVPRLCILNVGTVSLFSPSELVHRNDLSGRPLGCPYFQKMSPIILQKRYVIPIYKKMHFPEFQSFPTSSSFGKSVLKNTKEIFENTKENRWSEKIQISHFKIILFGLLNFMAGFLESQRFFWYLYCVINQCHISCHYSS